MFWIYFEEKNNIIYRTGFTTEYRSLWTLLELVVCLFCTVSTLNRDRQEQEGELFPSALIQRLSLVVLVPARCVLRDGVRHYFQEAYVMVLDFFAFKQILWRRSVEKLMQVQKVVTVLMAQKLQEVCHFSAGTQNRHGEWQWKYKVL